MASMPSWLPVARKYAHERDEEKDLQVSLKHYDRVLSKSASLGDYLSSIQHAHTCLLLHNRLVDIHLARQREKAERARQRGHSAKVAHHLLKIRQIEAKKLAVPAFVHPDYKRLTDTQDVSLAAEGSSALVPTASPQHHSPRHTSPHNSSPHRAHQPQQQQSGAAHEQQAGSSTRRGDDNVLYLLQHQMAAIANMQQQPPQAHLSEQHQQGGTHDLIRRLQHQATTSAPHSTRQASAPPLPPSQPPSDSPVHSRSSPRQTQAPPAYQPPTPHVPVSPVMPLSSPHNHGTTDDRREGAEQKPGQEQEEREGVRSRQDSAYNAGGEGQTANGPVVMLQGERGRSAGETGRETGATSNGTANGYGRKSEVRRSVNGGSPQSGDGGGKEEKEEVGEGQRETTSGPVIMLNAR